MDLLLRYTFPASSGDKFVEPTKHALPEKGLVNSYAKFQELVSYGPTCCAQKAALKNVIKMKGWK